MADLPTATKATPIEDWDAGLADIQQIQGRTLLIYGDSGDGKSSDLHSLARYYYEKSGGLPVRLVAAEDSSKQVFADLIDAGIVEAIFITASKDPLVALERIAEGEWPTPGDVEEKTVGTKTIKVQKWQQKSEWEGKISAYIFEGASTFSEVIADYLRETGQFPREQKDAFTSGGRTFMAASQTAIYFTQTEAIKLIKLSGMLPVLRVAWSAHEAKGKDEFANDSGAVRGPRLIGSAATDTVRKYVGVLLHKDRIKASKDEEYRVYVTDHPDPKNPTTKWKAKVTLPPTKQAEFTKKYQTGYFLSKLPSEDNYGAEDGLIPFLRFEDELRTTGSRAATAFRDRIKTNNA